MSKQYTLEGSVKVILETQTFASGFQKREFVVTTDDKYPQDIKFEMVKDRCALLDDIKEGQQVVVHFDIRGNEYKERYYVNLNAWKIEAGNGSAAPIDERPESLDDAAADSFVEMDEEPFW